MGRGNRWGLALAIGLIRVGFGFQLQTIASLGPELTRAFGIDYAMLGTLVGVYMASGVVVALPSGFAARRFGDYRVAVFGLLFMVGGFVLAAAGGVPAILLGRLLSGMGVVVVTVLQGKIIADRFSGKDFTLVMGAIVGSFPIGLGLAQVVLPGLAASWGLPAAFLAGALAAAVPFALFLWCWAETPVATARSAS